MMVGDWNEKIAQIRGRDEEGRETLQEAIPDLQDQWPQLGWEMGASTSVKGRDDELDLRICLRIDPHGSRKDPEDGKHKPVYSASLEYGTYEDRNKTYFPPVHFQSFDPVGAVRQVLRAFLAHCAPESDRLQQITETYRGGSTNGN